MKLLQQRITYFTKLLTFLLSLGLSISCQRLSTEKVVIGFSQCVDDDAWRQAMRFEMEKELAFYPEVQFIYRNADGNSQRQIQDIRSLQREGVDLLIISPNEAAPITPVVEELYRTGTPVIVVDRKITSDAYSAYIGADNYEIGRTAGAYAASLLPEGGKVLEVTGLPGSTPAQERHRGFLDALRAFPHIRALDTINGEWERNVAKRKLQDTLASYTAVDLIFAHNDMMALAAYEVLQQSSDLPSVKLLGIDGLSGPGLGIEMVSERILDATFLYPTGGDRAIQVALDILKGRVYQKENILQTTVIDPSNVKMIKLQADKIMSQQHDIVRQQRVIQEQLTVYHSQQTLLYVVIISLVVVMVLGAYALYSLREKQVSNRRLRIQNDKITHQRNQIAQMAQATEAANQAKFTFFTNISHEFRTPLTLILASVEELLEKSASESERSADARQDLLLVRKNASRLLRLINQLLDFRRLEHDEFRVAAIRGNIVAFLQEVVTAFEKTAQRRGIDYQFVASQPVVEICFDATLLDKVFFNLLSNAFKFTPDQGSIKVMIEQNENQDGVRIRCVDDGQGMSAEQVEHAFNRFYQGQPYQAQGTGLGLSLSKEIVERHGGAIRVDSRPGYGTCFEITIPAFQRSEADGLPSPAQVTLAGYSHVREADWFPEDRETASAELTRAADPPAALAGEPHHDTTVLVVEDNDDLRSFLTRKLQTRYRVIASAEGTAGLAQAFAHVPDLIVCDVMLPGENGLTIARTLKNDLRTSHIPIILLTARATPDQQLEGLRTGADAYVMKPFHPRLLLEQIDKLLWNREQLRQRFASTHPSSEPPTTLPDIDQQFMQRLTALIQQNLAEPSLNVNAIAQEIGLSRVQLYRKVKALLGIGVNDYIKGQRLKKAKTLLLRPDFTIAEVAYAVGFSSPAYFSTVFKAYYQQSPSDFVRSHPVS